MNKNKKLILVVALLLTLTLMFAACDLEDILGGIGGDGEGGTKIVKVEQVIGESYDSVTDGNFASVVASNNMAAIYEVTCIIEYSVGNSPRQHTSSNSTAFAINAEGYLMTNAHCVTVDVANPATLKYISRSVFVNLANDENMFECEIIAYDQTMDLCLLKILPQGDIYRLEEGGSTISKFDTYDELEPLPYVTFFAHTDPTDDEIETPVQLYYGESVVAIGNANGFGISVTTGVVSAPYRNFLEKDGFYEYYSRLIQTDATINVGNSGGPLFNIYGAVIGINTFKIDEDAIENMAYSITTYVVLEWLDGLADGAFTPTFTKAGDMSNGNNEIVFTGTHFVPYFYTTTRAYSSTGQYTSNNIPAN